MLTYHFGVAPPDSPLNVGVYLRMPVVAVVPVLPAPQCVGKMSLVA
jgi:hypothetical protein